MSEAIISLITIHLLADYPLQGDFLAKAKSSNTFLLYVHSFMWAGMIYWGLDYYGLASPYEYLYLGFVHANIDKWKCARKDKSKSLTTYLYIDQAAHMVQIALSIWVLK